MITCEKKGLSNTFQMEYPYMVIIKEEAAAMAASSFFKTWSIISGSMTHAENKMIPFAES